MLIKIIQLERMIIQGDKIQIQHAVCGGGLVGTLWALYLRRRSTSVAIFQSYYDLRQELIPGGRSINLVLSKKSLDALQQLGIRQQIIKNTIPIKGQIIHCSDGSECELPYGITQNDFNYCVARNKLSQILYNIAQTNNVPIFFQHQLKEGNIQTNQYTFNTIIGEEQKQVKLKTNFMYGADGAGSVVRQLILNKIGLQSNIQWYPAEYKQLFLPAEADDTYPLDPNWVHLWPRGGHMIMGHPNNNGTFSLTLILPSKGKYSFTQLESDQKIQQYMKSNYQDLYQKIPGIALQFKQNPVGYLGTITVPSWHYKGKVVMLGDAAHTICPFMWQAVNVGMDDCLQFDRIIGKYGFSQRAFQQYFKLQKPKADALSQITLGNFDNITTIPNEKQFWRIKKIQKQIQRRWPLLYWSKYRLVFFGDFPYNKILILMKIFTQFILMISIKNYSAEKLPIQEIQKDLDFLKSKTENLKNCQL